MLKDTTINKEEVKKFSALAKEWWDESGQFKPLHDINPVRIKFIKETFAKKLFSPSSLPQANEHFQTNLFCRRLVNHLIHRF